MKAALTKIRNKICHIYHYKNFVRIEGGHKNIRGDVSNISGNVSGIRGNASGISGDIDECCITASERANGVDIEELVLKSKKLK